MKQISLLHHLPLLFYFQKTFFAGNRIIGARTRTALIFNCTMFYFSCLQLILMSVLNCLYDSVSQILRRNVEKRAVLDSLDIVMLAMDEICDGGLVNYNISNIPLKSPYSAENEP